MFAGGEGAPAAAAPAGLRRCCAHHEVVVSGAVSLGGVASSAGLRFMTSGPDVAPRRAELRPIDMEHEYRVLRDAYAGRSAGYRTPLLRGGRPAWNPGIVADDRRRPARSSSSSDMVPPRARGRARAMRDDCASASVRQRRREQIPPDCPVCLNAAVAVVDLRQGSCRLDRSLRSRGSAALCNRMRCAG